MGQRNIIAIASIVGVVGALVGACSAADIAGDKLGGNNGSSSGGKTTPTNDTACTDGPGVALTPEDPAKYPKCACEAKGGAARCIPKGKVPANVASVLETCTEGGEGVCVPDPLVKSGGKAPPTCKSPFGEGRCLSLCVPDVGKNADLLGRGEGDICAEDERCAPCLNPLKNNEPTGVCEIGKQAAPVKCEEEEGKTSTPAPGSPATPAVACPYTGPAIVDVATFDTCGTGPGARCVPTSLVPGDSAKMLGTCKTKTGTDGLCAPEKSIQAGGQYLPKTCKAVAAAEGRCLNANIPQIGAQKAQLTQDACDTGELCAPCFNPLDGKPTGACNTVTCDAPKQPAKGFTACCTDQGTSRAKCVPTTIVPASQQGNLDDDDGTCVAGSELCVPNEMLQPNFKGPACNGNGFIGGAYTGVCLSDCLSFGFIASLGISRGDCTQGFKCAPCTNPLTGAATGAPGCPGT